jgi:hypothetical protein
MHNASATVYSNMTLITPTELVNKALRAVDINSKAANPKVKFTAGQLKIILDQMFGQP